MKDNSYLLIGQKNQLIYRNSNLTCITAEVYINCNFLVKCLEKLLERVYEIYEQGTVAAKRQDHKYLYFLNNYFEEFSTETMSNR